MITSPSYDLQYEEYMERQVWVFKLSGGPLPEIPWEQDIDNITFSKETVDHLFKISTVKRPNISFYIQNYGATLVLYLYLYF